jgi:hypothetical protein
MIGCDDMPIPLKPANSMPERAFYIKDSHADDLATERMTQFLEANMKQQI